MKKKKQIENYVFEDIVHGRATADEILEYKKNTVFDVLLQSAARIRFNGIDIIAPMRIMKYGEAPFYIGIQKTKQDIFILWQVVFSTQYSEFWAVYPMVENFKYIPR